MLLLSPQGSGLQQLVLGAGVGEESSLTVTGALRTRVVARVAVSDTAVGAWGILTTLGPAQGRAPLTTFVHI